MSNHVLLVGPGRVGGTLLMQIFTELGLPTGFDKGIKIDFHKGERYEWPCRGTRERTPFPYIIKEPKMCTDIDLRVDKKKWDVDHVYILLRQPGPIACALDFMARDKPKGWEHRLEVRDLDRAERGFMRRIMQVTHLVAHMDVPHTLVSYPRWAEDPIYFSSKFKFLLDKFSVSRKQVEQQLKVCVDQKEIERVKSDMPPWLRKYMREWIT